MSAPDPYDALRRVEKSAEPLDPGSTDATVVELIAWAEAGARVPPLQSEISHPPALRLVKVAVEVVKRADDDRAFQAALNLAQRLRRDMSNIIYGMHAAWVTRLAAEHRRVPPGFASRYAPRDEEVRHIFAGEAIWASRFGRVRYDEWCKIWSWLADAPDDRAGFTAAFAQRPESPGREALNQYPVKLYAAVDDYQRWLAR